jgi:hypothetical protein
LIDYPVLSPPMTIATMSATAGCPFVTERNAEAGRALSVT